MILQPDAIDLATPPPSFTVQGNGFANLGFGLPIANFVRGGLVLAQARATAMSSTSLTVPFPTAATAIAPNLPGLSAGPVEVQATCRPRRRATACSPAGSSLSATPAV